MDITIRRVTTPAGEHAWLVTDYAHVKALLADSRLGHWHPDPVRMCRVTQSSIFGGAWFVPLVDSALHVRFRRLFASVLSAQRMASLRPRIVAIVAELLDAMAHHEQPVDLHEVISLPLPTRVIGELLGVPHADQAYFRHWSADATRTQDVAHAQSGLAHLWEYLDELIVHKQAQPADDLISELAAAAATDPVLTTGEVARMCAVLLFAGDEAMTPTIDRGVKLLLIHPEQAAELRRRPALIEPAVEEILRWSYQPPSADQTGGLYRYANTDFTLGATTVKTGELVILGLNAANLDERLFPEPHRFNAHRTRNPHLAFGHGLHFCLGAALSRVELQVLFSALLHRFPTLRLAAKPGAERNDLFNAGVSTLLVTW